MLIAFCSDDTGRQKLSVATVFNFKGWFHPGVKQ